MPKISCELNNWMSLEYQLHLMSHFISPSLPMPIPHTQLLRMSVKKPPEREDHTRASQLGTPA